jgi:Mycotoxin biosynthesis protein UstYa
MPVEDSHEYQLDTPEGLAQWKALIPGDGLIYLQVGKEQRTFSISMMHQLRCLDILRSDIVEIKKQHATLPDTGMSRHCLNYLRQMILCRADLHLESVRSERGIHQGVRTCRNWDIVYREVERNQEDYMQWQRKSQGEIGFADITFGENHDVDEQTFPL